MPPSVAKLERPAQKNERMDSQLHKSWAWRRTEERSNEINFTSYISSVTADLSLKVVMRK